MGALLTFFQPIFSWGPIKIRVLTLVAGIEHPYTGEVERSSLWLPALIILIAALAAVFWGYQAFKHKHGKTRTVNIANHALELSNCVIGLAVCGALCIIFGVLCFNMDAFLISSFWGIFYLAAAFCAYRDTAKEHSSQSTAVSIPSISSMLNKLLPKSPSHVAPTRKVFEPVIGIETIALIKRGRIFISDDDFDEAERYFEQALRQDPENMHAYLGKLMAEQKVHNLNELSGISSPLSASPLFKHALEFASDEAKITLQKCLNVNAAYIARLEAQNKAERQRLLLEAQEKKYQKAISSKKHGEEHDNNIYHLKQAKKLFEELGDYKDSESLAEALSKAIAEAEAEHSRKKEEALARRAQKRAKFAENLLPMLPLVIFVIILIIVLLKR